MDENAEEQRIKDLWEQVNILADKEDENAILQLLTGTEVVEDAHVGADPESFTPLMTGEWVLGQWLSILNSGERWMLNTARNISFSHYEKLYGDQFGK